METKSAVLGGLSTLIVGAIAFGGFAVANADNVPAPAPVSTVAVVEPSAAPAPAPAPEVTVSETPAAPAPVAEPVAPAVEPAPVAAEPAPVVVEPAPVYVAPEPVQPAPAPVYVAPAPQETYIATNTDAKVAVDSKGYIIGGPAPMGGGDGPGKVDLPSK